MDHAEFRHLLGADPKHTSAEAEAHRAGCAECAKYAEDMVRLDQMIAGALAVPGPRQTAMPTPARRGAARWYALAASLLLVACVAAGIWFARERDALYADVVQHADGERKVMVVTDKRVPPEKIFSRMSQTRTRLVRDLPLSTVRVCKIRGVVIPHLILQTPSGAVHVMVLDDLHMLSSHSFEKAGYQGVIVPDKDQLIAVVGASRAAVDEGAALARGAFEKRM
jgi:hypothetical protein